MSNTIELALLAYNAIDPVIKAELTALAYEQFLQQPIAPRNLSLPAQPGRPEEPKLVSPRDLPRRSLHSLEGKAALWHAIAHIEFNAINLALDAFLRFEELPLEYYSDWLRVAHEEAYHFSLISEHLNELGYPYGSFPAHNSLWEMAERTAHDPLVRMALVPRIMEARGLDVTPGIMQKLSLSGDEASERILSIILRDEIGHVAVGNRWFKYLCLQRNLIPLEAFESLAETYLHTQLKGPYDRQLREQAGFTVEELNWIEEHYP